jgi:dTDP-4-amino-4,6-dideoxygalactose transaminase
MSSNPNTIALFKPFMSPPDELMPALERTLYSGYIAEGPRVVEFEQAFAEFIGVPADRCVAVSSCTAALHLALILAGVKPGDEVLSTPMTAEPTNLAVLHAGGKVAWMDVNPDTGNVERKHAFIACALSGMLAGKPRAVLVVDYGGLPVDVPAIASFLPDHIPIIEDAAHALGATLNGRRVGQYAEYTCFSFQAIKTLPTGDGGMLVCHSPDHAARARRLRWFGIDRQASRTEVDITEAGWKYNMNDIAATIGLAQLKHLPEILATCRTNAAFFDAAFKGVPGLEVVKPLPNSNPSYWLYTLLADPSNRNSLETHLKERGVACGRVHRRNDWHSVFAASKRPLPGLDAFWSRMLHIPCGWWLTVADLERIATAVQEWTETR